MPGDRWRPRCADVRAGLRALVPALKPAGFRGCARLTAPPRLPMVPANFRTCPVCGQTKGLGHEGPQLAQIPTWAPSQQSHHPPQGARLRHQQDAASLQSSPGLIAPHAGLTAWNLLGGMVVLNCTYAPDAISPDRRGRPGDRFCGPHWGAEPALAPRLSSRRPMFPNLSKAITRAISSFCSGLSRSRPMR